MNLSLNTLYLTQLLASQNLFQPISDSLFSPYFGASQRSSVSYCKDSESNWDLQMWEMYTEQSEQKKLLVKSQNLINDNSFCISLYRSLSERI